MSAPELLALAKRHAFAGALVIAMLSLGAQAAASAAGWTEPWDAQAATIMVALLCGLLSVTLVMAEIVIAMWRRMYFRAWELASSLMSDDSAHAADRDKGADHE